MTFDNFIGQQGVKQNIKLLIDAVKNGRPLVHIGLYGPAGCGKTTLAEIIAKELHAEYIYINGAAVTSSIVFRKPITKAVRDHGKNSRFIIMVDECHAIPKKIQNTLLSVLEEPAILCTPMERKTTLSNGTILNKGDILKEKLPDNVTFIFATTEKGSLTDALSSRLHEIIIDEYTLEDKRLVVKQKLLNDGVTLEDDDCTKIGEISKNMRHLVKLCDRAIDFAKSKQITVLKSMDVSTVISILGINDVGCDKIDQRYIEYVTVNGPVALSSIARYLNVAEKEVQNKIEPFLIRKGWIKVTPKGRTLTEHGTKTFTTNHVDDDNILEILGND